MKISVFFQLSKNHNSVNFCRRQKSFGISISIEKIKIKWGYKFDAGTFVKKFNPPSPQKNGMEFNFQKNHNSKNICRRKKCYLKKILEYNFILKK